MNPVLISRSSLSPVFSRRALEKKVISSQFKAASLSTDAPVSSVSISVATDSKVAPLVAALFFRTTRNNAANYFPLVFEMRGNNLQSSSSREIISLKASFLKDDTSDVIDSLLFNLFNPSFYDFELIHAKETALQLSEKVDHAVDDALHRTAFRRGHLVNSPYLKEFSDVSIADFDALVNNFSADKISILGYNVDPETLKSTISSFTPPVKLSQVSPPLPASKYYGGEHRIHTGPNSPSQIALAFNAPSLKTSIHAIPVLKALLDGKQRVLHGNLCGTTGLLSNAVSGGTSVTAFSKAYSENGLFGFNINGSNISTAQKSIDALKSVSTGDFDNASLLRAQNIATVEYDLSMNESGLTKLNERLLFTGSFETSAEFSERVLKVGKDEVVSLAKNMLKSNPTLVSMGDADKLFFLDELKI